MIKYNLKCENNHVFEAWFKNSSAYDEQSDRNIVSCSLCGSTAVEKAPMAPSVPKKGRSQATPSKEEVTQTAVVMSALREIRKTVEENCDYVGEKFAEEARKIHYGEVEERGIYGEATTEQREELEEEGVPLAAVPWLPNSDA
ncbi:MAG: DUF1178 family protein [Sneathiella sp.]